MAKPTISLGKIHSIPCLIIEYKPLTRNKDGYNWQAHYYLNIPLKDYDARRYDHKLGYLKVTMGRTNIQTHHPSFPVRDGEVEQPFRDGAHIQWDAVLLKLPMYKVYKDIAQRIDFTVRLKSIK